MRKLNRRQTNFVLTEMMGVILALAVAFFFVAMPSDVFERLVSVSGLPLMLAAAEPPLSDTTRMIVGALAGSLAGIGVILLFLFIDRRPEQKPETVRPFFASNDLVPAEAAPIVDAMPLHFPPLQPEVVTVPFEDVETPAASEAEPARDEPIFLDFQAIRAANQPVREAPLDLSQWKMVEPAPVPVPFPTQHIPPQHAMPSPPAAMATPDAALRPISRPDRRVEEESIAALMKRLETGLDRRAESGSAATQPPAINRSGAGLSSTLDELRKMATRR
jgi:hypothetical protein